MSMYLRQQWTDPKLKYNVTTGIPRIELDNTVQSKIWVPDLSFMTDIVGSSNVETHTLMRPIYHLCSIGAFVAII
jgi:hypothetical protein